MQCEVIVVGGGIGGLTVAAMLAARGIDVCLFERQSHAGGCVANFEHLGQSFDPTFGLYSGWETGGVWQRVFAKLPVGPPQVTELEPNFVVRLPDGKDVTVSTDIQALELNIAVAFPACANEAVKFIRAMIDGRDRETLQLLKNSSDNFRSFIDAQLAFLAQGTVDSLSESRTVAALRGAVAKMWQINGGAQSLADSLATGLTQSGGRLRLNSPVLRLAYDDEGKPSGVDLLSGERVTATRAIVSNLTAWDTYGKLVGLSRTPSPISTALKRMSGWGVYQVFILIDEAAVARLPALRIVCASLVQDTSAPVPHMMLNISSHDSSELTKRTATLTTFTHVDDWFSFHEDSSWHEEQDQATLEKVWMRLHEAVPEIAGSAEVFETATPQTYYESVRRKMGMIGSPTSVASAVTPFKNLFLIGDTAASGIGFAGVAEAAERVVDCIIT